ncbi:MAG: sulfotransferase [Thermodesulfobacteria bacterium]|nr:sulfotransferase [Thermodesulfobacteriota bacterium]
MTWTELESIKLVFCTGSPKSGTTFLQMILDNHPEVSCPPEHYLYSFLTETLPSVFQSYNKSVEFIDKMTAKQGAPIFTDEDIKEVGKFVIKLAAYKGAKGKEVKWYGIKDDQLTERNGFTLLSELFPEAKFVAIVRDPRSVCVSAWYFNIRLDENWATKIGTKEEWASVYGPIWVRDNTNIINFFKKHSDKIFLCRYEDLVLNPFENYKRIFEFLGVSTDKEVIEEVIDKTSFKKFKDGKFFRKASIDDWKNELSPLAIKEIEKTCGHLMQLLGYKPMYW